MCFNIFRNRTKPPVPPIIQEQQKQQIIIIPQQEKQIIVVPPTIIDYKKFTNYVKRETQKDKVVIHGTAGGTANGAIGWMNNPQGAGRNVATHFVIDQNANIIRLFPQKYFAYHAGSQFRGISETSFGIEIVNWLNLQIRNGSYYTWTGKKIRPSQVYIAQNIWRGYKAFHKITQKQHKSLQILLKYLCQTYGINKKFYRYYDKQRYIDPNFNGIVQHSSFHLTKMDFEPNLIPTIRI